MYLFITQSELVSCIGHCEGREALSLPGAGRDFPCEDGRQFAGRQSCFLLRLLKTVIGAMFYLSTLMVPWKTRILATSPSFCLLWLPPSRQGIQPWESHRTLDLVVTLPWFLPRLVKLYIWTEDDSPCTTFNGMVGILLVDDKPL